MTPIHLAAAKNKLDTLKWLSNHIRNHYTDFQAYIDARALNGETPLYFAAQEGHLQVVIWLVDKVICSGNGYKNISGVAICSYNWYLLIEMNRSVS